MNKLYSRERAALFFDVIAAVGALVFVCLAINEEIKDLEPLSEREITILIVTPGGVILLDFLLLSYKYKKWAKNIEEGENDLSTLRAESSEKEESGRQHEATISEQETKIQSLLDSGKEQLASISRLMTMIETQSQLHEHNEKTFKESTDRYKADLKKAKTAEKYLKEQAAKELAAEQAKRKKVKDQLKETQTALAAAKATAAVGRMWPKPLITDGYGEYIVFKKDGELTFELYSQAYTIIDRHIKDRSRTEDSCSAAILEELRQVDAGLEITFIPRTLYDMILLKLGTQEEEALGNSACQNHQWIAERLDMSYNNKKMQNEGKEDEGAAQAVVAEELPNPICWHSCGFNERMPPSSQEATLRSVAFKLNQAIVTEIMPTGFLSLDKIHAIANDQITFFDQFYTRFHEQNRHNNKFIHGYRALSYHFAGLQTNARHYHAYDMRMTDTRIVTLLRNAVELECSPQAKNAVILYRAGWSYEKEKAFDGTERTCFELSLLAGAFHNGEATVLYNTMNDDRRGLTYALILPYCDLEAAPYHVPSLSALENMYGEGDYLHAEIKLAHESVVEATSGYGRKTNHDALSHRLDSGRSSAELQPLFEKWRTTFIDLR